MKGICVTDPVFRGFYTVDLFDCPPFQMFTNGDDPRGLDILEHKRFEPHSMKLWCRYARDATSILDIGAHTGVYALAAASLRNDIEIHAFEPNPYTAARLRVHKYLNGFENIVEHAVALSEANGITEITWIVKPQGWLSSGAGFVAKKKSAERAPVYTNQLDHYSIAPGERSLVKIDVEGWEQNVFLGMQTFLRARPTIILESFDQANCDAISAMLPGYRFAHIDENGSLTEQDRLLARRPKEESLNQLCIPIGGWSDVSA